MKQALLAALVAAALLTPLAALSFGTINGLGQHAEHEHITRAGLAQAQLGPRTLDLLAGRNGSFGAVGAPDNPLRGLMSEKAAHCDGGDTLDVPGYPQSAAAAQADLQLCRTWMRDNLSAAVESAGRLVSADGQINAREASISPACVFNGRPGRAKCEVLDHLGLALHASEDFYAHSNWVDQPAPGPTGPTNPPGLNNRGRAPWIDPRIDAPFPGGLITGCYDGFPESRYCTYDHGQLRVRHAVLNKDEGVIDISDPSHPHIAVGTTARGRVNSNFEHAVQAAIDDTADKWAWFEGALVARYGDSRSRRILCLVRSDDARACR